MNHPKDHLEDLADLKLDTFLDQLADRTPTPGGGGVTAAAGALATALARMVAAYSIHQKTTPENRKKIEHVARKLHNADQILRALITQDAVAYERMTEAGKKAKENPETQPAYQEAVLSAVGMPMEVVAIATQALDTMDSFKDIASRYLLSDLAVSAVLADAAARAARYIVGINLTELKDADMRKKLFSDVDQMLQRCDRSRGSIESFVRTRLESPS